MAPSPQASINQASEDWQATKAAYAFFANPTFQPGDILLPHQQRTLERMAAEELVLAIQDTCFSTTPTIQLPAASARLVAVRRDW